MEDEATQKGAGDCLGGLGPGITSALGVQLGWEEDDVDLKEQKVIYTLWI